jgi:hypothetical protein
VPARSSREFLPTAHVRCPLSVVRCLLSGCLCYLGCGGILLILFCLTLLIGIAGMFGKSFIQLKDKLPVSVGLGVLTGIAAIGLISGVIQFLLVRSIWRGYR